jgi:hypothetical protein
MKQMKFTFVITIALCASALNGMEIPPPAPPAKISVSFKEYSSYPDAIKRIKNNPTFSTLLSKPYANKAAFLELVHLITRQFNRSSYQVILDLLNDMLCKCPEYQKIKLLLEEANRSTVAKAMADRGQS